MTDDKAPLTETERRVWEAWHALPDDVTAPVKRIAAALGIPAADVAFIVYPAEQFGPWDDSQEPDDHAPTPPHVTRMDEAQLLADCATDVGARATTGMLIHWLASDPASLARFAAWMEHCPGDLPPDLVLRALAVVHSTIEPFCDWPVPGDPPPGWGQ